MSDVAGIYLLRNSVSGRVYVGQSIHINRRWYEHKKSAKRGEKSRLYDAMRKYGPDAFTLEVLEECAPLQFDERECFWMEQFRATEEGYNLVPGGQRGRIMDEATRERIASKLRGRKLPADHVEAIRQGQVGRRHSEATKAKMSASSAGKKKAAAAVAKTADGNRRFHASMTAEQRAEWRKQRTGWKHSQATCDEIGARFRGKKKTPEQIVRMKMSALNRNPEAEARRIAALRAAFARKREEAASCSAT